MNASLQLSIFVFKINNNTLPGEQLDIDTFFITPNLTVNQLHTSLMSYEGELGLAVLSLSFTVSCATNYYGADCAVYCNGSSGLYHCNETDGSIVCLKDYRNQTENYTECIPTQGCCKLEISSHILIFLSLSPVY